jgi:hypothetical protein
MAIGRIVADTGEQLMLMARPVSVDLNERHYVVHLAVAALRPTICVKGRVPTADELDRALRVAMWKTQRTMAAAKPMSDHCAAVLLLCD